MMHTGAWIETNKGGIIMANKSKAKIIHPAPTKAEIAEANRKRKERIAIKEMTGSKSSKRFK